MTKRLLTRRCWLWLFAAAALLCVCGRKPETTELIQLNWFHDPTFAGEYELISQRAVGVSVREGGPTLQPLNEVTSGRATYAVIGVDIFVEYLDKALEAGEKPNLVCFFADFQRNPVGWVLHPDVTRELG